MSSWVRLFVWLRVAQELSVDDVGEPRFQAPQRFFVALACGSFAAVVGAPGRVVSDLGDRHDVQCVIELPVAGAGEPVAHGVAGGHFDRGGAVERGECGGGADAVDRPTRARIFPALSARIPQSSVSVVPDSLTAAVMALPAVVMRRSRRRTSLISSAASRQTRCAGRTRRSRSAAVSALS